MRVVIQRVSKADVQVEEKIIGKIDKGLLVYLGFTQEDNESDLQFIANKLLGLRIFPDQDERLNLNIEDVNGSFLLVSQFTLFGDVRKGKRPSFSKALSGEKAKVLYDKFVELMKASTHVETGVFGADMKVSSVNDGPVTILLDSSKLF